MKINFDRICRLAGVESGSERKRRLSEGADHKHDHGGMKNEKHDMYEMEEDAMYEMEEDAMYEMEEDAMEEMEEYGEGMYMKEEPQDEMMNKLDEVVEVDPRVLMEEIRRAKKIKVLRENRRRSYVRKQHQLQENHLKRVIRKEIQNIMSEIDDVDNSWVYGENKPRHSRKGYTNHGRTLPGIGFNKKW